METNKKEETKGRIYVVDGKEWIIGEKKISKWSKSKCNQPSAKDDKEEEKKIE